jgi:hypothetical protein
LSEDNKENKKPKIEFDQAVDDLLQLNESIETEHANNDEIIKQVEEQKFDINNFSGFPIEQWVKYQGTINDTKQRRRVAIAGLDKYKLRYNASDDDDIPEWQVQELQYYPITVRAWQKRQSDMADVEDKNREIGALDLQLSEIQNSIRIRTLNMGKPENNTPKTLNTQSLEELQKNVTYLQNLGKNMKQEFQKLKNDADRYAFKIYFHKEDIFDKVRSDDLEDILGACDWKQLQGPANLLPSKNLPMPNQPGVK